MIVEIEYSRDAVARLLDLGYDCSAEYKKEPIIRVATMAKGFVYTSNTWSELKAVSVYLTIDDIVASELIVDRDASEMYLAELIKERSPNA